jgi:hypothetical protein
MKELDRGTQGEPPQVQVTDERRDVQSMLELVEETKNPNLAYKFVKDDKMRIARHRMRGYRPVNVKDGVQTVVEHDNAADGLIRVGDTILMAAPKTVVQRRKEENEQFTTQRLAAPKKSMKEKAQKHGVEVVEDKDSAKEP